MPPDTPTNKNRKRSQEIPVNKYSFSLLLKLNLHSILLCRFFDKALIIFVSYITTRKTVFFKFWNAFNANLEILILPGRKEINSTTCDSFSN